MAYNRLGTLNAVFISWFLLLLRSTLSLSALLFGGCVNPRPSTVRWSICPFLSWTAGRPHMTAQAVVDAIASSSPLQLLYSYHDMPVAHLQSYTHVA